MEGSGPHAAVAPHEQTSRVRKAAEVVVVPLTVVNPHEKTNRVAAPKQKPVPMERVSKATVAVVVSPSMEQKFGIQRHMQQQELRCIQVHRERK